MKVTIEEFNTGGGWYLMVNGCTVAALLPADVEYITKRFGTTIKHMQVHDAVEQEYANQREQQEYEAAKERAAIIAKPENWHLRIAGFK